MSIAGVPDMLDKMLIEHCSPTLGGLKTANLFGLRLSDCETPGAQFVEWNRELKPKGVSIHILSIKRDRALVYVCRTAMLAGDLEKDGVQDFLKGYGYREFSTDRCIDRLMDRLMCLDGFPHEIGLFLGYPLEDVKGFIENAGQNYEYIGEWKVYHDECDTRKRFMKFKKFKEVYTKLFENRNWSVLRLTVAVS